MNIKYLLIITAICSVILIILLVFFKTINHCRDFSRQSQAQAAYNAGQLQLDGDHDGVACENLPK